MRVGKIALAASFTLVIGYILVLGDSTVNHKATATGIKRTEAAHGMPMLPPPKRDKVTVMADGMPLPPPQPQPKGSRAPQPA
jgi:hypothetical protein